MEKQSSTLRRAIPVVVGVGAIMAGSIGLSQADPITPIASDKQSAAGPCGWSTHWQTGRCVDLQTPKITRSGSYEISFACPAEYPYPFESAFSGNPTWYDRSHKGLANVQAVAYNGLSNQKDPFGASLSYAGASANGTIDPGYVTVTGTFRESAKDGFVQGHYQCSDTPAKPR